ncbi:MAG: hydantoinase/oxoprolinase family protein, partial [Alphaproteobacteria bacterium]|nr:hydantoinase/oxoprolinase family protein [Alphaproteobacteria bacterium]
SFGGAAGLHVADVARQLDLTRVIVPRVASVLSAWGMLATDLRFEVSRTHIGDAGRLDGAAVKRMFDEMEAEGRARLAASYDGKVRIERTVEMRYGEQIFEIAVPLGGIDWAVANPLPQIVERFHARHEELYTYALRNQEAVLVNARAAVIGVLPDLPQEPALTSRPQAGPTGQRRIHIGGWLEVPVYTLDSLAPGQSIGGPAIVESAMTTVLLRPGNTATVTPHGWLDIAIPLSGG